MHIRALRPEVAGPCLRLLRKVTVVLGTLSSFGKLFAFAAGGYLNEFDQKFSKNLFES